MPLNSRSQIVGGGANLQPPTSVGSIPQIVDVGPPGALSDSILREWLDGAVQVITVGAVNVRAGVGATETFRLRDGFISEGAGADSFRAGRNARATQGTVAIGVDAGTVVTTGNDNVFIGNNARGQAANVQLATVVGAGSRAAGGATVIGANNSPNDGAWVILGSNNFGAVGAGQIIIGNGSSITNSNSGGIVVGFNVTLSGRGDIIIGTGASTGPNNNFNSNNVVIGASSFVNVTQGHGIIIGAASSTTAANCIIIGPLNTLTATQQIVLGRGLTSALANHAWIGAPSTNILTVVIGQGDTVASPGVRTLRFTNALGTNNAAGDLRVTAPRSTGNALAAGIELRGGEPVGSGTALQTDVALVRVVSGGSGVAEVIGRQNVLRIVPVAAGELRNSGNTDHVIQWGADTLGFFGAGAVARPTVPLGSSTDDLLNALATLGLIGL